MSTPKRIVVKVGSSLLVNTENLTARYAFIHGLFSDIAELRAQGYQVVLASSGSVALGLSVIGKTPEEASVQDKQAAAACGQLLLLNVFKNVALEFGFDIAQILVTLADMEGRRRFLNTKNTMERLFESGILPIVNENDTITTEEIRVGDNDRLAAKVAQMIQADYLTILTSIDGLYDKNPSEPDAKLVEEVEDVSQYLAVTQTVSTLGSGGMFTKMQAAHMAQNVGCETLICEGTMDRPILGALNHERKHTRCIAKDTPQSSWAIWLTDRLHVAGSVVVSDEFAEGLKKKKTGISPENIKSLHGNFSKGDVLHIYNDKNEEVARGLSNFSADEAGLIAGHPEQNIADLLGYKGTPDIIIEQNLIILQAHHLQWDAPEVTVPADA